ncbi:MAG: hypothetical protein ACOC1X_02695 [Promethearchaeota archaeon]
MSYKEIEDFLIKTKIPTGESPEKWIKERLKIAKKRFGSKALTSWINRKREERFIIWETLELQKLNEKLNE